MRLAALAIPLMVVLLPGLAGAGVPLLPVAPGWLLSTEFPCKPALTEHPVRSRLRSFAELNARCGSEQFGIHRIVAGADASPRDVYTLYQTMKAVMLNTKPSVLLEEERIEIEGIPALRYVISYDNGQRRVEFRDVLVKMKDACEGYLLMCDYDASNGASAAVSRFFNGIRINK